MYSAHVEQGALVWFCDKNPVGSYRRNFTLPENWKDGRRVFIHFDGACSAIVVWVNGQYAEVIVGSA